MPSLSLHLVFGSALLLISPLASALGFGPTRNHTTLGQQLNFAASVLVEADESVSRDCISADVLAGDHPVAARHVRAVLETTRDPSRRIVRVTTSVGIDEPVATIEISIGCGSRIVRRFVAFIDPPSLQLAEAAAPSETVPLPSSRIDSQVATLADVARRADASRRLRDGEARPGDREPRRPPPRRAAPPPAAVTVASALPVPTSHPRRATTDTRRRDAKSRTALAAAPRSGARLQLDPPRALAVASRTAAPTALLAAPAALLAAPTAALAAPARVAMAASAPPAAPPRAAADPLLAQVHAAAAAAAGASARAGSPEQQRMQALEEEIARMRSESQKTQETLLALQTKVRQAEQGRYRNVLVYVLAATTLLGVLIAASLWWLRPRQRRRARWFDAQANQQARAAARGEPSTSAGLASQPAPLSRPAVLAPPVLTPATRPAALRPASTLVSPSTGYSTGSGSLLPTTQHSSIGGLEVTTVLGPEVSRSSFEAFGGGPARPRAAGELTMEDLIDLEQQAEFFVVLGQDEAAMSLLEGYIDGTGKSPLPYLQLLEIHQRRDDRDAYDNIRESFNERFHASAPDWSVNLHSGRSLEDYPQTVALLQSLWATPLSAMQALDKLLFRREEAEETFDFPAYRELLFLYSVARELSENVETDSGSIDLYLPLDDAPLDAAHSQISELEATRPLRGPLEVDLDVSQWPEDAAMSDLLGRPKPSGRRGAA